VYACVCLDSVGPIYSIHVYMEAERQDVVLIESSPLVFPGMNDSADDIFFCVLFIVSGAITLSSHIMIAISGHRTTRWRHRSED
jgi:hypothetical protein